MRKTTSGGEGEKEGNIEQREREREGGTQREIERGERINAKGGERREQ
jgi:hypothetical protein